MFDLIVNVKITLLSIFCLLFSIVAFAGISEKYQVEISYLIEYVKKSECVFNRNGVDYKGSEAVVHMQRKYDYYEDEIKTTENFIALSATKSEMSGRNYTVQCKGSEVEPLGQWLLDVLGVFRKQGR